MDNLRPVAEHSPDPCGEQMILIVLIKMELKMNRIDNVTFDTLAYPEHPSCSCGYLRAVRSAMVVLWINSLEQPARFADVSDVLRYLDCNAAAEVPSVQVLTVHPIGTAYNVFVMRLGLNKFDDCASTARPTEYHSGTALR